MAKNALWLFGFTIVLLALFLPSYAKMQDLKEKNRVYQQKIDYLQKRNVQLEQEQRLLTTDPVYLEKVARKKMGLIREGETVYKMVPATKAAPKPTAKPVVKAPKVQQ
jgi:cell division protein FtsB